MIRGRRKVPMHTTVSLVALGDIAFLLITFFLLSTNFARGAKIEVDSAQAPGIDKLKETPLVVQLDKKGQLWLRGKPCTVADLETALASLAATVENKTVTVTIDKNQRQADYGPVILAVSRAGLEIALAGEKDSHAGR